jgi:hypothetical protein
MRALLLVLAGLGTVAIPLVTLAQTPKPAISDEVVRATVKALVAKAGPGQTARIERGVAQVAQRWWSEDGDAAAFAAFCTDHFVTEEAELTALAARLETVLEQVHGHLHELRRELLTPLDLDRGPVRPVDELLATLDLGAHVNPDLFRTRVAFLALLNFPVHTLAERLEHGASWDRETWARSALMDAFAERVPAEASQALTNAATAADRYIANSYIRLDRLRTADGRQLFPEGLRLISHWGLRDELRSHYGQPGGLERQRMIAAVMGRIVRQEIPAAVIDNPDLLWAPETNAVLTLDGTPIPAGDPRAAREGDTRYARWLDVFHAMRRVDPFVPTAPTALARAFDRERQIPEAEVERQLTAAIASAEFKELARRAARNLGRPLEPFDIWYAPFASRAGRSEAELDAAVRARYPDVAAFQADLPRMLTALGFVPEKAAWLAEHVVVDPSRGAGHAMGAARREDRAHLRTHVAAGGMDYKGYNIAVHEFGHNVEQVFSLHGIDRWALSGVPNNAFTEAFAYSFQRRDLELLGLGGAGAAGTEALSALWDTVEIGAVSLVDIAAWRFLYAHPRATPAELREAVLAAAREVWNAHFAAEFGGRDSEILAIYSHMVSYPLYLSHYALGHIVDFQVGERLRGPRFGAEFERMARIGRVTPDLWMRRAVGAPISAEALLRAARAELRSP